MLDGTGMFPHGLPLSCRCDHPDAHHCDQRGHRSEGVTADIALKAAFSAAQGAQQCTQHTAEVDMDTLRRDGPLQSLTAMSSYCWKHGGEISKNDRVYGYIAETAHYRFCLRCTPRPGEYQGYLYCYDLRQQRMQQQDHLVGRVTYASGEVQEFTDSQEYLRTIREELPYRNTTGFRHETLTGDPAVRKAVDDILLDFAGEENPRRTCNYGLTEKGKRQLQAAADLDRPHTDDLVITAAVETLRHELDKPEIGFKMGGL